MDADKRLKRQHDRAICKWLFAPLGDFMRSMDAPKPPKGLKYVVQQLTPDELALCALYPLVLEVNRADKSAAMKLKLAIGRVLETKLFMRGLFTEYRALYRRIRAAENKHRAAAGARRSLAAENKHSAAAMDFRKGEWSTTECVRAGNWLLDCALRLNVFELDEDGLIRIADKHKDSINTLRSDLLYFYETSRPATEPLEPWQGWRRDVTLTPFVKAGHPDQVRAIKTAFRKHTMQEHVDGVNRLEAVPWTINTAMIPVVEQFAGVEVDANKKQVGRGPDGKVIGKRVDRDIVGLDLVTAKFLGNKPFYVPHNCDFRGRVYGATHFNFQREDHVRSLFLFARGAPITDVGIGALMIHVANCGDFERVSKCPLIERLDWVNANRGMIMRTARDPAATVDWWCKADAPYSFVAGCKELTAAWETGSSYVTRLPICFDGSCSGVQHLAMMMRDETVGRWVNLIPGDEPQDVYQVITDRVIERLKTAGNELADWWLWMGVERKLVKRPAMTFGYSVTIYGMKQQLVESYKELHDGAEPTDAAAFYLARHIMAASKEVLGKPAEAMNFIRTLAKIRANNGLHFDWVTPTGFSVVSRHCPPNVRIAYLELNGVRVEHKVGDGWKPGILKKDAMDGATPDFTHSLDAAHLIRVVNAAASEGIDVVVIHDSFGCLAPQASRLRPIILTQFALLYSGDVLADLRKAAQRGLGSTELPPVPDKGSLDPFNVTWSEFAFA
jgi:DNA-directed RNA polymerase, mitochondrial